MPPVDRDLGDCSNCAQPPRTGFVDDDPTNWTGLKIRGQFYQEYFLDVAVFPPTATNVKLHGKNAYDNVFIPPGYTVMDYVPRRIRIQPDFQDWILDENDNPVEPINKIWFSKEGKSIDPRDIPAQAILIQEMLKKAFDIEFAETIPKGRTFFKIKPVINLTEVVPITVPMTRTQFEAFEAMEGDGIFDSAPTRNTKKEQGKVILVSRHLTDRNLDIYEPVVILEGFQTRHEVEGESWLFKDKRGVFYDV